MSVKETIHQWVENFPDDSPSLRELDEEARLDLTITEAKKPLAENGGIPIEEVQRRFEERWPQRLSA